MERQSVKSRILRSVGYDDSIKILEIEFQNGLVYQFLDVPPKVYADLMHSGEIGKYFYRQNQGPVPDKTGSCLNCIPKFLCTNPPRLIKNLYGLFQKFFCKKNDFFAILRCGTGRGFLPMHSVRVSDFPC